ncbi:MAG: acyl-CoA thioesterase [Flavobacteriales bacterium]|jgi:acyl-CoA thioester hydrolase|nr:acyl-CoA thioesterase [Flavobacteriales bacterium]
MRISTPIQIRFSDVDMARHVHNATYLHYFELGRMDLLRRFMEKDHDWLHQGLILARNEVDYLKPIHLDEPVEVQTWCGKVGGKSFDLLYEVRGTGNGKVHARGRSVMVCFDYSRQESIPVPEAWRGALAQFME